jgi:hypothetical protein
MMIPERRKAEEASNLTERLDYLQEHCEAMVESVRLLYGTEDERTLRAQELCNDLQRLRWALNRGHSKGIHRANHEASPKRK